MTEQTISDELKAAIDAQNAKGLKKYKTPLDEAGLGAEDFIDHAVQECVDGAQYLLGLKRALTASKTTNQTTDKKPDELVKELRESAAWTECFDVDYLLEAADMIEALDERRRQAETAIIYTINEAGCVSWLDAWTNKDPEALAELEEWEKACDQ